MTVSESVDSSANGFKRIFFFFANDFNSGKGEVCVRMNRDVLVSSDWIFWLG